MKRISNIKNNNSKFSKIRKYVILFIILIAIIFGVIYIANKLIPIKDITDDNISISLSTTKLTGNTVEATITSTTKYNIYYYIDYIDEETENLDESDYYEDAFENSNTTNTTSDDINNVINSSEISNSENSTSTVKNINNNLYSKMTNNTINIEKNGTVYLKYERFGKLSDNPYLFEINNIDKTGPEIGDITSTSTDSTITVTVAAADLYSTNLTYYFKLQDSTNYICTDSINKYMFTDLTEDETYTIYIKVKDEFGNESEAVTDVIASSKVTTVEKKIYYIKVNIAANTVTVYGKDEDGEYTDPIKAMVCSTGTATPKTGVYKISDRYRWRSLFGGVYGQYAVRIHGNILFHSVPYTEMSQDTLEYEEYDKLGTSASAGCIRLTVKDVKWIYDNVAAGSSVEFYSDKNNPGPLGKPTAQKISDNKANRNWDPTDPDSRNPWSGGTGIINRVTSAVTTNNIANTTNSTNTTNSKNTTNTLNNKTNSISNNTNTITVSDDPANGPWD
jgi:lipoprotein-anchoring transpeptidase ErfK/SrfK